MTDSERIALAREMLAKEYDKQSLHADAEFVRSDRYSDGHHAEIQAILAFARLVEARVREECAALLETAIAEGYRVPAIKADQCLHGKFGWEDCIVCYDEALLITAAAIRDRKD